MRCLFKLTLVAGACALLSGVSPPRAAAQVPAQDAGAVQTAIEETRKASEPAQPASAPTETASAPAAKAAVTARPAGDFTPVPAQSDAAGQQPPAPAGQRPRHVRKPLDKTHAIRGKGVSLRYSENWSVAPRRFANMDELIDVPPGHLHSKPLTSKIKITTEQRRSHEEALRRLEEVRTGLGAPASSYLTLGGWPAFQYRRVEERPSPGDKEELRRPQFKDDKMMRITTVVAAAELLVRLEAALPSDADPELIEETEAISRSLTFSSAASSRRTQDELARLRRAKPAQPAAAVASARPPAAPPAAEKNFTPVSGGASKTATLPLNEADLAPLRQEEFPEPGLTQRVITGRFGELEIAVSPNGRNIVIGQQSAFRSSNDGGQTFPFNGTIAFSGGDPSLAYGRSGNFYYAGIRGGCQAADAAGPAGYTCTGMARSTDNGQTFPIAANAVVCPNQTQPPATPLANACFPDQEHIAADRTNSAPGGDQVYSAWRNFDATDQDPGLVCSQDSGINWTAPITVGTGAFPRINVGQDGFVYVVYLDGGNYMLNKYSSCATGLAQQPGFPVVVTARSPVNCPFAGHDRCDQNPSSQTIAVDDTNPNHVYFSYSENTGNPNNENIMVRDSLDGGLTWPAARVAQVSSGVNGKRIMPWVCTTGGEAFVTWYDRRAATPCATPPCAANNDLTDYYAGRARLDPGGNLVVGSEIKLTEVSDPWCASGWPCGTRGTNSSESCSVQPQLAGFCCTGLDANGNCVGSGNRCDFNPDTCTGGETCQNIGGGCPKYGDYNGNACAAGRLFAAWASATSPPSIAPASTSIDIFYTSKLVGDVPQIQVPGNVAFGDACVGATATQTLNVCNTGNANLEVNSVASTNTRFAVTAPSSGYPVVISPGFCFPFQVQFTPTGTGPQSATLTINSNDPANGAVNVQATGNGTQQAVDALMANSGNFGQVCVGSFKDLDLTVNNSGGCDLVVNNVTSSSGQFIVAGTATFPVTVSPGNSLQVPIRFQPTSTGAKSGNITVSTNDPVNPTRTVAVSGTSDPGDVRVTGSTDFGDVCAGAQAEKSVSVCNVGACNLAVTGVTLNPGCTDFQIVNNPFPAAVSHDFCMPFTVRFTPTSAGPKSCTLTITTDDPDTPVIMKTVTANTPFPSIDVSPDLGFPPEVTQSAGACQTLLPFPISNKGSCNLTITSITTGGTNAGDFGLSALPSFPIVLLPGHTAGDGALMTVFSPTAIDRDRLGALSVTYESDPITHATTTVTRALCGEGVLTGSRVLVTAGGVPLASVESIKLQRINANRNRNQVDTVDNARDLPLQSVTPAAPCAAFQYHREYGTVSNPVQLLPGSYQVTVTAVVNGKRRSKTVAFDVATCDFNPTVVVDLQ